MIKIKDKFNLGGGTVLELNQFEQLVNGFILQRQSIARDLRDAKAQYNLYFSVPFKKNVFPAEAELAARAYNITGTLLNQLNITLKSSIRS